LEDGGALVHITSGVLPKNDQDNNRGGHENTTVSVTSNLAVALTYHRQTSASRVAWVNSICIDQQNNVELGHQITKMGDIYKSTTKVEKYTFISQTAVSFGYRAFTKKLHESRTGLARLSNTCKYMHTMVAPILAQLKEKSPDPKCFKFSFTP
jgi:hypothetical protein